VFFKKKPKIEAPIDDIGDDDFQEEVLKGDGITVVDFWAPWCGPCRMMAPILNDIAIEFAGRGVRVVKVNTDLAQETALQFEIRSIPTLIFFKDGEPLFQFAGLVPKKVLDRELNTLLGEATA
jgi:thioredoxin 1|tara:strand:+ start:66 stop:434 length:369 start_codon:yes stop_codon:yes gene_type:complete